MGLIKSKQERQLQKIIKGSEIPHFPEVTLRILERLGTADAAALFEHIQQQQRCR